MTAQQYEIAITATAEVRDKDGNLLSSEPVASTIQVTADQLREMGLEPEEKP